MRVLYLRAITPAFLPVSKRLRAYAILCGACRGYPMYPRGKLRPTGPRLLRVPYVSLFRPPSKDPLESKPVRRRRPTSSRAYAQALACVHTRYKPLESNTGAPTQDRGPSKTPGTGSLDYLTRTKLHLLLSLKWQSLLNV